MTSARRRVVQRDLCHHLIVRLQALFPLNRSSLGQYSRTSPPHVQSFLSTRPETSSFCPLLHPSVCEAYCRWGVRDGSGVHDSYTFPVQTGGIFYFPWHRHQIEGTPHRTKKWPTAFSVSSERHWQSGVKEIAKVSKRPQRDSNPRPLGCQSHALTTEPPLPTWTVNRSCALTFLKIPVFVQMCTIFYDRAGQLEYISFIMFKIIIRIHYVC